MAKNILHEELHKHLTDVTLLDLTDMVTRMTVQKSETDENQLYVQLHLKVGTEEYDMCLTECEGWRYTSSCYHIDKLPRT